MKLAFFTYPEAFQNIGGGEIQLLKTKEFLERAGQPVHLFDLWKDRVESFDFIHIFSSVGDTLGVAKAARSRGVAVGVSPVLWSDWHRALHTDGSVRLKADLLLRHAMKVLAPTFPSARRSLLLTADALFPNSEIEKKQIQRLFAIPGHKIHVVYNGVDSEFSRADAEIFRQKYPGKPFILCVGRIEPRKNQLNLIMALQQIQGIRLVLIGSPVSGYESYYDACQREGRDFTEFIPTLSHQDALLKSAYAACETLVLPAWFETPGLAALEGALAGAKIVLTQGGSTREYFGDRVLYCDPASRRSIRQAIEASRRLEPDHSLKHHVEKHYIWERVAERYLEVYQRVLTNRRISLQSSASKL